MNRIEKNEFSNEAIELCGKVWLNKVSQAIEELPPLKQEDINKETLKLYSEKTSK